jgi:hypothetical protein
MTDVRAFSLVFLLLLAGCDSVSSSEEDDSNGAPTAPEKNTSVTDEAGNRYEVGFEQVSSNNQDPYVEKQNSEGTRLWRLHHDETPVDGRAIAVALDDEDRPYVVFTTDGGSNDDDRFQRHHAESGAFADAPFGSYGSGGGPKVSIVARLDAETGDIERGTFLRAQLTNENTNTLAATGLAVTGDTVRMSVESAAWPPAAGATETTWERFDPDRFNNENRPPLLYSFSANLTEISNVQVLDKDDQS